MIANEKLKENLKGGMHDWPFKFWKCKLHINNRKQIAENKTTSTGNQVKYIYWKINYLLAKNKYKRYIKEPMVVEGPS